MEQRTDEWFTARLGKVTASRISDVMAKTKTGWGAARGNYMAELLAERLTDKRGESYTNAAMQWGIEQEPQAQSLYCLMYDADVRETGFVDHPKIKMTGASPDGLVGDEGLLEIKCPNTKTHIELLRGGSIERKYRYQMEWQMACTERAWCDFASYDPRLPESMQLYVCRFFRNADLLKELEDGVIAFLKELDAMVADLTAQYGAAA